MRTNAAMLMAFLLLGTVSFAQKQACASCVMTITLCTETSEPLNYENQYTGHDEPSVLFYSTLPARKFQPLLSEASQDPPRQPKQDGTGAPSTFNSIRQFWFSGWRCVIASPLRNSLYCVADSDANIFDGGIPLRRLHRQTSRNSVHGDAVLSTGWVLWPPATVAMQPATAPRLNIDSFSKIKTRG